MDSRICRCKFENEGRFFALVTPDGRLKVWDCTSGKLKHDINPNCNQAGSGLTCLSWRSSSKLRTVGEDLFSCQGCLSWLIIRKFCFAFMVAFMLSPE